jgi:hypothetical protein
MTDEKFWRLRAVKGLDEWTDAELEAEGTTRDEWLAYSRGLAKHLVWMRDHVWRYRWKKTGLRWLDEATMVLTPAPCARVTRTTGGVRRRERRSTGGNLRRGPPSDDPDLADPDPPPANGRLGVAR